MKVYVAGASSERSERAKPMMAALRAAGIEITHDWCADMDKVKVTDAELSRGDRERYALEDLAGIRAADIVWLLAPSNPSLGAWIEFGFAIANSTLCVVSGPCCNASIFTELADCKCKTDEQALAWVCRMKGAL